MPYTEHKDQEKKEGTRKSPGLITAHLAPTSGLCSRCLGRRHHRCRFQKRKNWNEANLKAIHALRKPRGYGRSAVHIQPNMRICSLDSTVVLFQSTPEQHPFWHRAHGQTNPKQTRPNATVLSAKYPTSKLTWKYASSMLLQPTIECTGPHGPTS